MFGGRTRAVHTILCRAAIIVRKLARDGDAAAFAYNNPWLQSPGVVTQQLLERYFIDKNYQASSSEGAVI